MLRRCTELPDLPGCRQDSSRQTRDTITNPAFVILRNIDLTQQPLPFLLVPQSFVFLKMISIHTNTFSSTNP